MAEGQTKGGAGPVVVVAVIGAIGTIIVALINHSGSTAPTGTLGSSTGGPPPVSSTGGRQNPPTNPLWSSTAGTTTGATGGPTPGPATILYTLIVIDGQSQNPIAGATCNLVIDEDGQPYSGTTTSLGIFSFNLLPSEQHGKLSVIAPGYQSLAGVEADMAAAVRDATIRLQRLPSEGGPSGASTTAAPAPEAISARIRKGAPRPTVSNNVWLKITPTTRFVLPPALGSAQGRVIKTFRPGSLGRPLTASPTPAAENPAAQQSTGH